MMKKKDTLEKSTFEDRPLSTPDISKQKTLWLSLALISVVVVSIFFRIYPLGLLPLMNPQTNIQRAQTSVLLKLRAILGEQVRKEVPKASPEIFNKLVNSRMQATLTNDRAQFDDTVFQLAYKIPENMDVSFSKKYMFDADSYYYYNLTENILLTDSMGTKKKLGSFYNLLRKAPTGAWDRFSMHPYIGITVYKFFRMFNANLSLMSALSYVPILLYLFTIILFFFLCLKLGASVFGSWIASMVFTLSPIVLQRTDYGWYDTDPYQLLFFVMLLFCHGYAVGNSKHSIILGSSAGVGMGFYSMIYGGWQFVFIVICGSSLAFAALHFLRYRKLKDNSSLLFLLTFISLSLFMAVGLMGFDSLRWSLTAGIQYLSASIVGGTDNTQEIILPNLLNFVNETRKLSAKRLIFLLSNDFVMSLVILGTLILGFKAFKTKDIKKMNQLLLPILLIIPLTVLAFKAMRFSLYVIVPFAILAGYSADLFYQIFKNALQKSENLISRFIAPRFFPLIAILLVSSIVFPRSMIVAHVAMVQQKMMMDDNWYNVLNDMRTQTDPNMIVFSDWGPGYFINGLARRKSFIDGGTQKESTRYFWMAKAFMAAEEKLSVGIFRMLSLSDTQAFQVLRKKGMGLDEVVALIDSLVVVNREQANKILPQNWSAQDKTDFLDLTHGNGEALSIGVLIYNDFLEKTPMLEMFARWNFAKAQKILGGGEGSDEISNFLSVGDKNFNSYPNRLRRISGDFSLFKMKLPVFSREKDTLFFADGIVLDKKNMRAFVPVQGEKGKLEAAILYYKEDGKWKHSKEENPSKKLVLIHYPVGKSDHVSAVAPSLMKSTLFRLFYFEGQDIDYFKPISTKGSLGERTYIQSYEINWSAFERSLEDEKMEKITA